MSAIPYSKPLDSANAIAALMECDAITEALHQEHKALEQGLLALRDAVTEGANQEILMSILAGVENFCLDHFESEERFFRDRVYIKADAHMTAHQQLIQRFRTLGNAFSRGQSTASDISTLMDSFHNHVVAFDKPAYVWSLWQNFEARNETPQQIKELCSLDRLGKLSW